MSSLFPRFELALRLALREMRGGLSGFYIFLACIALGTGAIAAVNSVSKAITVRSPRRARRFWRAMCASS